MSTRPVPLVLATEPFTTATAIDLPDDVVVVLMRLEGVTLDEIPEIFDHGFGVLSGLEPIGPGFACYRGDMDTTFELTLGFPVGVHAVGQPADLPDGVEYGKFPAGSAWVVSHLGAYDGLPGAWEAFVAEVGPADGTEAAAATQAIEIYVSDPSRTDAGELRTDLVLLPG